MQNETEVIAQTCHEANRAFSQATGNPGIPNWANLPESQRNATRQRVTQELQRLRTGAPPGNTGIAGSRQNSSGEEDGSDMQLQMMSDNIFSAITRSFWETQREQERLAAAAA